MDEPFFGGALIEISAELTLPFPQKRGNKSALFHISNTTMSSQYTQKICVVRLTVTAENPKIPLFIEHFGPDHVQVFWKHKCFGNISQLETRPLIG